MILAIIICNRKLTAQEVPKVRIDPSQGYGGSVSDFFQQVDYIPLETNKESAFGDAMQVLITDTSIVVYDYDTRCVLFFNPQGKYISKIKFRNDVQPNISLDNDRHCVAVSNYNAVKRKIETKYYDYLGLPLMLKDNNVNADEALTLESIGGGYFATVNSCYFPGSKSAKDSVYNLIAVYKGNKLHKNFIPYNQRSHMTACAIGGYWGIGPVIEKNAFYVSTPLDHDVYRITKDSCKKLFQFVFPGNRSVPQTLLSSTNQKEVDSLRKRVNMNTSLITKVSNIFFNKNLLFFKVNTIAVRMNRDGSESEYQYNFIYDTLSRRLSSIERIKPDSTNAYLPLLGAMANIQGLVYKNGYFYSTISSLQMFKAKESPTEGTPKYPAHLEAYFNTQDRKSNPVIVRMKLKTL